jgi:hypothetical protein
LEVDSTMADLVLSYYARPQGRQILEALTRPFASTVYVGTYGIDTAFRAALEDIPNTVYAPMFTVQPGEFWKGRRLTPEEKRKVPDNQFGGPLPPIDRLLALPSQTRVAWGTELGRRFRDSLRHNDHTEWQFDEILSQVARDRRYRDFIRGALDGIALGRQRLNDGPQSGVVWMAAHAAPVASVPLDAELAQFWSSIGRATKLFAGEEYPTFTGDASGSARMLDDMRRALQRGGPVRKALAAKYVAGVSPGVELRSGLGGNIAHLGQDKLRRWRKSYVRQRTADGARGAAYFDLRGRNGGEAASILREL